LQARGGLPEALFYWPITAGGLGLTHPFIPIRALQPAQSPAEPPVPASRSGDWQSQGAWGNFYRSLFVTLKLREPVSTPGLESLLNDFIQRGSEVGGRQQKGLSAYWKWVVYTYGPALLESWAPSGSC
jgi:hypothetical protein